MNYQDHQEAAVDAIASAIGARISTPHPLAAGLFDPLSGFALAAGKALQPQRAIEPNAAVLGRGLATDDFSKVLADSCQLLVSQIFDVSASHRAFCAVETLKDFRTAEIASLDVGVDIVPIIDGREIPFGVPVTGAGNTAALATYARIIGFSRQLILNDQLNIISRIMFSLAGSAASTEASLVSSALESNPVLDDGELTFHADLGNLIDSSLPGAFALGMAALRKQKRAGGMPSNLDAKHLVVSPDIEVDAKAFAHINGLDDLSVSVLAGLPNGRWYMLADPAACPSIAVLSLRGSKNSVLIEQQSRRDSNFDGTLVKARADLGATLLGRLGIVRGGL